ncbi:unnamed protein product [[Actinomadura] parvosata subsp. kistnae]|uniref:hypothetical protein n=1 Tax=[Actinomadura] parvosata TaxID=1955412 RepID=UPI000D27A2F1|nr:unnamed protein product [Actinomadura parvosata subsp. kistnae]
MFVARMIVVAVLAALAGVYVLAGAPGAVLVFAVQCLYTLWSRAWWLLAAQAVLVFWVTLGPAPPWSCWASWRGRCW